MFPFMLTVRFESSVTILGLSMIEFVGCKLITYENSC